MGGFEWTTTERLPKKRCAEVESDVDITSMVDLTFLLLVFFMVMSSFACGYAFESKPNQTDLPGLVNDDPVPVVTTIEINSEDEIALKTATGREVLRSRMELNAMLRKSLVESEGRLLVIAHPLSSHAASIHLMDVATGVGATRIQSSASEQVEF